MRIVPLLAAAKPAPPGGANYLYILIAVMLLAYLVLVRPQRQRAQRQQKAMKEIAVGDDVVTVGGIVGRVTSMEGDRVWLELDAGVVVEFLRQAVARRLETPADAGSAEAGTGGEAVAGSPEAAPTAPEAFPDTDTNSSTSGTGITGRGSGPVDSAPFDEPGAPRSMGAGDEESGA